MSKLKKSVKAIIISICAVVVIAGSCLGAVLLNKKSGGDNNNGNKPEDAGIKTEFVGAQIDLMNTINSIKNDIEVVEKVDSELIKQSGFSIDKIYEINDNYFIFEDNDVRQLKFYSVDAQGNYSFVNLYDKLSIETQYSDFELLSFANDYFYYTYTYSQASADYRKLAVSKIIDGNLVLINEYNALVYSDDYFKIQDKYSDFELRFGDDYYVVYLGFKDDFGVETFDIYVYSYTDEFVADSDAVIYRNISADNDDFKFYDNYYFIDSNNILTIGAYDKESQALQILTLTYGLNEEYNFIYTKYGIFIIKKKGFERIEDLTKSAFYDEDFSQYYEYEYSYYSFKTQTTKTISLSENAVKAEFIDVLANKYLVLFEQGATNYNLNETGKLVYYDLENLNKILVYESSTKDNQVIYSNNTSILTKQGIFKVNNGNIAEAVLNFGTRYSLKTQNLVCDNFIVYDSNEQKNVVMDMTGRVVLENKFVNIAEYDGGYYIVSDDSAVYLLDIKTLKLDAIQNFDSAKTNSSLAFVGFGVYVAGTENNYSLYNFKGELLETNISAYGIVSYANGTALKLTFNDNKVNYYFIDAISMFESSEESSSSASQSAESAGNFNFTKTSVEQYKDTDGGTTKTYYVTTSSGGLTQSGSASISHTSAGAKNGYTTLNLTVKAGYLPTKYAATFVADKNEDAGFVYHFNYTNNYGNVSHGLDSFVDDTRWYPGSTRSLSFGVRGWKDSTITFQIQYKNSLSYYSVGSFDDAEDNYLNVDCMTYTVTLDDNGGSGGSGSFTYTYITSLSASSFNVPSRTGYTFNGYYYDGTQIINSSGAIKITNSNYHTDFTATASWTAHTYSVRFNLEGGNSSSSYDTKTATFGTNFTVPNPTRLGYTFNGWNIGTMSTDCDHYFNNTSQGKNSTAYNIKSTTFRNLRSDQGGVVDFFAKWKANTYSISYDLGNGNYGTSHPTSATYNSQFTVSNPTKIGYTFSGWYISYMSTNCTHYFGGTASGSNSTASNIYATTFLNLRSTSGTVYFTATWTPNTYSIRYGLGDGDYGTSHPTTATYDTLFTVSNPTLLGYTFSGWNITGMSTDCEHYWNSSFNGTSETASSITATSFKNLRSTAGIVTFTATWTPNTYTINYVLNGGEVTTGTFPTTATYDEVTYIPGYNLARTGYYFTGWNISGMTSDCTHYYGLMSADMSATGTSLSIGDYVYFKNLRSTAGTVTFSAKWTPNTYHIAYDANGGVFNSDTTNPTTATYDVPFNTTSPIRHGYNFSGWKAQGGTMDGQEISPDDISTGCYPEASTFSILNLTATDGQTVTLVAQWYAVYYDIDIVYNSHLSNGYVRINYDQWYNIPNPVKTGYTFAYWEISGTSSCGHTSGCACFSSADNGECSHYYNTSASDTGVTRFTGTLLSQTTATYFKNLACVNGDIVTFTAHWTKKTYKVINAGASYGVTLSTEYPKYDEVFSVTVPTSSPLGYHFDHWYISGMNQTDENTGLSVSHYGGVSASSVNSPIYDVAHSDILYFKNLSSNAYVDESSTSAIVTITPMWAVNVYSITFDMNSPNRITSDIKNFYGETGYYVNKSFDYDSSYHIINPIKTGYTFLGWSLSDMTDDCTHYHAIPSEAFESVNGSYKNPDNPNKYQLVKDDGQASYLMNLRSDTGTAKLTANWQANTYTITYHYIPASFNVQAYNASQLFTHINTAGNMTGTVTVTATYDKAYTAIDYKNARGEENFELPAGLKFKLWSISATALSSSTSVAKYNDNEVVISALDDSIQPNEKRIYGPGKDTDGTLDWTYYGSDIHLYACYDLAGINLRYFVPSTVAGKNKLGSYSNVSSLNINVKYTESFNFVGSSSVVDGINLMGWMISADFFSSGDLTEQSVTVYQYNGVNHMAYHSSQCYWPYTNVDAYSYEDPTYYLYAVYSDEYSGSFDVLSFEFNYGDGELLSAHYYSVMRSSSDALPATVKIPKYYYHATYGFIPVEDIDTNAFMRNSADNDQLETIIWFDSIRYISYRAFENQWYLKNYTLNEGLVYIDDEAFLNCDSITQVVAPSTLKYIGVAAFWSCDELTTISLNEGLKTIEDEAFYNATKVTGVLSLPSTLCGTLGWNAFYGCSGITSVEIPSGITEIDSDCFASCSKLATVNFASGSALNKIDDYAFWNCSALTSINIPNSVTYIGNRAFYANTKLTSVTMPDSLEFLGEYAFYNCVNLASIVLPRGLTVIKYSTFSGCAKLSSIKMYDGITKIEGGAFDSCSKLTSVTVPNSVTEFGGWVFYGCSSLQTLSIPFVGSTRTSTGNYDGVFGYLFGASSYSVQANFVPTSLTSVIVTDPTQICDHAFYGCNSITSIEFANSLQTIGSAIFESSISIRSLKIPFLGNSRNDTTNDYLTYFWNQAKGGSSEGFFGTLGGTDFVEVILTDATHVGDYAFYDINTLCISLNEGITSIGNYAFANCTDIYNIKDGAMDQDAIVFPSTLKTIGDRAFQYTYLVNVNFNEGLESIGNFAFVCCNFTSLKFPTTLRTIGNHAFDTNRYLNDVQFNEGLTSIGELAFNSCMVLETIKIPTTITVISAGCFEGCHSLHWVYLHDNITKIENHAFYATAIYGIDLPKNLVTIGIYAFAYNANLALDDFDTLIIPSKVTSIGAYAFYKCTNMTYVKFETPETHISIDEQAFYQTNIKRIELPAQVTLSMQSFGYCTKLEVIVFNGSMDTFGRGSDGPFYGCSNLKYVYLSEAYDEAMATTFSSGGENSFGSISTSEIFPGSPEFIYNFDLMKFTYHADTQTYSVDRGSGIIYGGDGRLHSCDGDQITYFDVISIPSTYDDGVNGRHNVTEIEPYAYSNKSGLMFEVVLPNTITTIGRYAFCNCNFMEMYSLPSSLTTIGMYAFYDCESIDATFTIPAGVTRIEDYTFAYCDYLRVEFALNSTLNYIGTRAFCYCAIETSTAKIMSLPNSVKYIGDYAFYYYGGNQGHSSVDLVLPTSLLYLGEYAYASNHTLRSVVLPDSLECINKGTFAYCYYLYSVFIPESVKTITADSTSSCPFLNAGSFGTLSIYCESTKIPSGWGKYWNYNVSDSYMWDDKYARVFMGEPVIPDVIIKQRHGSGYDNLTQTRIGNGDGNDFAYETSTSLGSASYPAGLVFEATGYVVIRFEYMIATKDPNLDMCVEYYYCNSDVANYPVSLKNQKTTQYLYYSKILYPGDKLSILINNSNCTDYNCALYIRNLYVEPVKDIGNGSLEHYYYGSDSSYEEICSYSSIFVNGLEYYPTGDVNVSFGYSSYCTNLDSGGKKTGYYFTAEVYAIDGSSYYTAATTYGETTTYSQLHNAEIGLFRGTKLGMYFVSDPDDGGGSILNFYVDMMYHDRDFEADTLDYRSIIGSIAGDNYPFLNATTSASFWNVGSWTNIWVTTQDGWEVVSKRIVTKKYNAKMTFRIYTQNENGYEGLSTSGGGYFQGPFMSVSTSSYDADNQTLQNAVAIGTFLTTYNRAICITLTIPEPGAYYLHFNLGGIVDQGALYVDIACLQSIGVDVHSNYLDSSFSNWSSGFASVGSTTGANGSSYDWAIYYRGETGTNDFWDNDYYEYVKNGDYSFESSNAGKNGSKSSMTYVAPSDGLLTFNYDVSTETRYDIFVVYLNDEIMFTRSGLQSGSYAFSLEQGDRVKFQYIKDSSVNSNNDRVWVRYVHFEPCYVFKRGTIYGHEAYISTNQGASDSECVFVVHPYLTNVAVSNSTVSNLCDSAGKTSLKTYYKKVTINISYTWHNSIFESIYDRFEIYNAAGTLIGSSKFENTEEGYYPSFTVTASLGDNEYFIVKFIKDSTVDYGEDSAYFDTSGYTYLST